MKQTLITLSAALICAFGISAQAQDTATSEATTETATETPTTDDQFPVADENQAPQAGQIYVREVHGSWEVHCVKAAEDAAEDSKEPCRLYQLLSDEDGTEVAEINIRRLADGGKAAAGVDFASPLGSLLTAQVVLRVDAGKAKRYPYSWCDQFGCFSRFGLTGGEIANMRKGAAAKFTIAAVAAPKAPIKLAMPLTGFTAAWNAVAP